MFTLMYGRRDIARLSACREASTLAFRFIGRLGEIGRASFRRLFSPKAIFAAEGLLMLHFHIL